MKHESNRKCRAVDREIRSRTRPEDRPRRMPKASREERSVISLQQRVTLPNGHTGRVQRIKNGIAKVLDLANGKSCRVPLRSFAST